jgi:hypothetical protein
VALRPEDRLQTHCVKYLKAALPEPGFFSGIEHARKQSTRAGNIQRAKGVKRGLADLNIWYLGKFIGVELKVKSSTSDPQKAFGAAMDANGFDWHVVRSVVALHDLLVASDIPVPLSMRIDALNRDAALSVPAKAPRKRAGGIDRKPTAAQRRFSDTFNALGAKR